ncbi:MULTISPECIES: iron chelate uptake ABC transporter family permease subunit [Paenibacillus]|uniref:Iron ABC transporter permease n=1 Tax=Paenibacillus campinasensis TaxID=66347 RepID=A0A268ERN2_9BACL|nr:MULTISPECIES: iron chelate uptake ABC transporter family permease subunit [Paenibacillus]MUG66283.1 iron chelate uptake ABC transporter family permease subunit [Paenibacillus campinasensis]PAD75785.1 iron ABC transporter permease [Paenibacillus campinasensis]PAK54514.1 iron ABC transporter permease [Paenibacillus sp. 7541]
MNLKGKIILLAAVSTVLIALFLLIDLNGSWDYAFPRRVKKVLAIVMTGGAIALSTMVFQTVTNNRILTPSVMGLDSLYMLIQTTVIFVFGSFTLYQMGANANFLINVCLMVIFSGILYKMLFRREGSRSIFFLLLIGMIFGTLFSSMTSFMEVLIDPNEFQFVSDKMFASFNNVKTELLLIAGIVMAAALLYFARFAKYLNVISLGREQAINLGVPYDYAVKRLLIVVAILISAATALVGPITFLGLLVVNVAYEWMKTYRHSYLITASILISVIALVGGQLVVERVFTFSTTLSVIINFIGGVYFIYLLLKESKA